jgi:flagellar hook-associated protein 3 FlgL
MRISTQSFFARNLAGMSSLQQQLFRTQQKLASGTKYLTPSDDPVAAARALGVSQSMAETAQYAASRGRAVQSLSIEENALQSATSILQNVKTLVIQAGNGTLTDTDRATLATTLQSNIAQLLGVANSDDGDGQFLFAGYKSAGAPFVTQADGSVQYAGDQGPRLMQVDVSRLMSASDDGRSVFLSVQGSAGYVTTAGPGNTGSGVFGRASVTGTAAADDATNYVISFTGGNYTVATEGAPPVTVAAGVYVADAPIAFGGLQISIGGAPADGDEFRVGAARNAGTDIFGAISDLIASLKRPLAAGGAAAQAQLRNALSTANVKITNAHDNVLTVRSSVGSRMAELDALDASGSWRDLVDRTYLSELQDLDYASAISEFSQRETSLKATQQTFARLQSIALFNYL